MVTAERRLGAIERSLTPTQLVLRWLDEAHGFGSLESYTRWVIDQPTNEQPLDRLVREAAAGARGATRANVDEQGKAVRRFVRETVFRFELVMRINVTAHEMIDREVLVEAALAGMLGMLAYEDEPEQLADPGHHQRLASCHDISSSRVAELRSAQEARSMAEARYLDRRSALFPDVGRTWHEQLKSTERLAGIASSLAENRRRRSR